MSHLPPNWDQAWKELEPKQPRRGRGGCYALALATVALLAAGVLGLAYLTFQQRTNVEPGLSLPGTEQAATAEAATAAPGEATLSANATATSAVSGLAPTATLPGDVMTDEPPPPSDVFAPRLAASLDGELSDWSGVPAYASPYVVFTGDTWDGSDDVAATWQVGWDDIFLYFAAEVIDDSHVQTQSGSLAFRGDSIELQIDSDRAGDFGPSLSPDDFQISLSPGDFAGLPASAWLFQGTPGGDMRDAQAGHGIVVAARRTDGGYVLEGAIPWRDLNLTPAPGLVIGLAVNVNDNDRPGTAAQEMMKSSAAGRRFGDPTTWGTLTLQ